MPTTTTHDPISFTLTPASALQGAIDKWTHIASGDIIDRGARNCPLCMLYEYDSCVGCPVNETTGDSGCESTPYADWTAAGGSGKTATTPRLRQLAVNMRDYLIAIRDKTA